jgi:hypothetical protein
MRKNLARFLAGGVSISALIWATTTQGQTYNSRCGWTDGVYVCTSRSETPTSVTTTLCGSGGIDAACTSKTEAKKPPPGGRLIIVPNR